MRRKESDVSGGSVPDSFLRDLGPGAPLDEATRSFMEPRFGHEFGLVRVHYDARAAESARAVHALAYTLGRHVVFAAGRYEPDGEAGRRLLAHELTHVLQQESTGTVGANARGVRDELSVGPVQRLQSNLTGTTGPSGVVQRAEDEEAPGQSGKGQEGAAGGAAANSGGGPSGGYEPGEREASFTSPGKIENTPEGSLLYGFPVNSKFLKREHQEFLKDFVKRFQLGSPKTVTPVKEILGFTDSVTTSRSGGNKQLREDRAEATQLFLATRGGDLAVLGQARAAPMDRSNAANDTPAGRERNRAVLIRIEANLPPEPEPKPGPPHGCPPDWNATVRRDHDRALNMIDIARSKLDSFDGTSPAEVATALAKHFKASGKTFAGWVNLNLGLLRRMAPHAEYECVEKGTGSCDPHTQAYTIWCVPLFDIRVCNPTYFQDPESERSTTLIHEWVHKYGCNFDLGYDWEKGYKNQWTITALLNADPFAQFVKDVQ